MTWTIGIEDVIVGLMLAAVIGLATESLRRRLVEGGCHTQQAKQQSRRFMLYAMPYIAVFMVCGVLRQTGTLLGWPAYVVFGILIGTGVLGWRRLRRVSVTRN